LGESSFAFGILPVRANVSASARSTERGFDLFRVQPVFSLFHLVQLSSAGIDVAIWI
jgi:hypothetical protein